MSERAGELWVTGVGLTTALGVGVESTWTALLRGDRAIRPLTLFDGTDQRVNLGAEVRGLRPSPADRAATSRTSTLAVTTAREALAMAGLDPARARVGLIVGTTTGGLFETELLLARLHAQPDGAEALDGLAAYPLTGAADAVDRAVGPFARVRTVSSACSSGANAAVVAASWLQTGDLDAVVAGGCDSLCRLTLTGFNALAALDPEPCRPFDRRRRGTSLGEGAGFLVIERRRDAIRRGARGLAELCGWASGAEAFHVTHPEPSGRSVASLIEAAMARAGLEPADLDYVNAHGTGTRANDAAEAAALAHVLGREVGRVAVSSSKGQLGHTLGAAGAIEAAITTLVVSRSALVPTGGLEEPDPEIHLAHVPGVGRPVERVRAALSNAFGFGGMNAVLAFRRIDGDSPRAVSERLRPVAIVSGSVVGPLDGDRDALDPARSRRFDDASSRATVASLRALRDAEGAGAPCGVILGTAFGTVDGTGAFMHRVATKGTRYASPADFPNLLPSTSAGHVSIYAGLTGPVFGVLDPRVSGEGAIVDAMRLVATGVARRMLAGSSDPCGGPVVAALARVVDPGAPRSPDGNTATVLLLEDEADAARRGGTRWARVEQIVEWRGAPGVGLAPLRPPASTHARVFVSRFDRAIDEALRSSPWNGSARSAGGSEDARVGLGTGALLAAVNALASGDTREALVWGGTAGGGYAVVLVRGERGAR